jgi:G3E family GTPase
MTNVTERVPVTVLTGFLGSGKTTLLNRILTEQHGKRIAVIENEFGEVGVDQDLVINAEEEIFEMNNGCICCTVRGDLIRILGNLMKRKDRFDYILIETTGLADPGPVAQTFFVDDEMQGKLRLDGIVTLVDAKHVWQHIDESDECKEQIAFADVILLNKTDLVPAEILDKLESRIKHMNAAAKIHRCQNATVALERILNVGGFNLDRALEVDPKFLEPEYPFEWGGIYELEAGTTQLTVEEGPDPAMNVALLKASGTDAAALQSVTMEAVLAFAEEEHVLNPGNAIKAGNQCTRLQLPGGSRFFFLQVDKPGPYALFTEHHPDEFQAKVLGKQGELKPLATHEYKPDHEHDEEVTSVGITSDRPVDQKKFSKWMGELLQSQGTDIFRMKGVLNVQGSKNRVVFQGVHMLFDGREDRPWGADESKISKLIFIGRHLDRAKLNEGFYTCLS